MESIITNKEEFYNQEFSNVSLFGKKFDYCIFSSCDFREANFSRANFSGTDLMNSLFGNTNLAEANFVVMKQLDYLNR
ncbi:pentapeptide repeat-containing protein [Candidatus Ruthia endofausta]|uniref:Pentapeptide repeat-containing protein n=1 Tax=Candidatus Ruthia endofausta TaxID=2738852 RepID=A0A6N0HN85_9GAMM|nr:pentapeptide repeat-containing protein [Candidatus Ruthia endofausta]